MYACGVTNVHCWPSSWSEQKCNKRIGHKHTCAQVQWQLTINNRLKDVNKFIILLLFRSQHLWLISSCARVFSLSLLATTRIRWQIVNSRNHSFRSPSLTHLIILFSYCVISLVFFAYFRFHFRKRITAHSTHKSTQWHFVATNCNCLRSHRFIVSVDKNCRLFYSFDYYVVVGFIFDNWNR